MTPSHDAPDTGPTSFDDGPAPATLGLSRREMRAAERARARALGIDEAGDAPADEQSAAATEGVSEGDASDTASADEDPALQDAAAPSRLDAEPAASTAAGDAGRDAPAGIGTDTSAILLSGGVLTRRQLRAMREAEEAARQQRGSEHGDGADDAHGDGRPAPTDDGPRDEPRTGASPASPVPVDDSPADPAVPPYVRYGSGSRATPRPRAPYGSAYRTPALAPEGDAAEAAAASTAPAAGAAEPETPSAWPFAPISPSGTAGDRDVDTSGERPMVPPLASHVPEQSPAARPAEAQRSAPSSAPSGWGSEDSTSGLQPAFGTRAVGGEDADGADREDAEGVDAGDRATSAEAPAAEAPAADATAADEAVADTRTPFTPPAGHWSVQDQVDEDQPHTGNHFILPTVPQVGDMQQALNSTGEIIITGSIDLPRSLGSIGTHPDRYDSADMDRMLEQDDDLRGGSDAEPVRASRAVSTHTSTRAVVQPPPRKRFSAPIVGAVVAGGLLVIGGGLAILAAVTNVF